MKTLKIINYKGIEFELYINEYNKEFYFDTSCKGIPSKGNSKHANGGWDTPKEAIKDMEEGIDNFLSFAPNTYQELADAITDSLVWTGYEECYADENIVKILVENFIKASSPF